MGQQILMDITLVVPNLAVQMMMIFFCLVVMAGIRQKMIYLNMTL